jgi:hypothetical protein
LVVDFRRQFSENPNNCQTTCCIFCDNFQDARKAPPGGFLHPDGRDMAGTPRLTREWDVLAGRPRPSGPRVTSGACNGRHYVNRPGNSLKSFWNLPNPKISYPHDARSRRHGAAVGAHGRAAWRVSGLANGGPTPDGGRPRSPGRHWIPKRGRQGKFGPGGGTKSSRPGVRNAPGGHTGAPVCGSRPCVPGGGGAGHPCGGPQHDR